jgi:hypothetical protein
MARLLWVLGRSKIARSSFSEEKEAKRRHPLRRRGCDNQPLMDKSSLVLSFKKEHFFSWS